MIGVIRYLAIVVIALALAGCGVEKVTDSGDPPGDLGKTNPVTLDFGESIVIERWGLELTFDSILVDSRCPLGVQCFWEGEAVIGLRVTVPSIGTNFLALPIRGGAATTPYERLIPVDTLGYRFTLHALDPHPVLDDPALREEYTATFSVFPFETLDSLTGEIQPVTADPLTLQNDPFQLDTAWIEEHVLHVDVHYGGGCQEHEWTMYMAPPAFLESYPVQANLFLSHEGNNDACEAWIAEHLTFDLRPVEHLFMLSYGDGGPLYLNLYHYFTDEPGERERLYHCVNGVCPLTVDEED